MVMHQRFEAKNVVAETQQKVFEKILMRMSVKGALQFFTAETGLGKTTGARLAMRRIWDEVDPSAHFLVLVPTRKDADIFWQEMEKLAPGQSAVWTQYHDPVEDVLADFKPSVRFTKFEAAKKKCLILTHNAGKAAEGWVGRRDAVLIDEYPQPVPSGVVHRWQFVKAEDEEQSTPYAKAARWAEERDTLGLSPTGFPAWVYEVLETAPKSEAAKAIKRLAEHMAQGTAFQRRFGKASVWRWYTYDLPFEEKAVVFSATAHLEGWHFDPAQGGTIERDPVKVNYQNMTAKYVPWPNGVSHYHDKIQDDPDQREALVAYVAEKVGTWNSGTLVVCPKPLKKDIARRLKGAKITHWGCDVGSNEYRDCDTVWLVSLFHKPSDVLFLQYLGHARQYATDETLEPGQNTQSSTIRELKRLHHATHVKQMAARGSCRNVDGDGLADQMELNCIFPDRDLFTELLPELFRGVKLVYEQGSEPATKGKTRTVVVKIADYLQRTNKDCVSAQDLKDADIKIKGTKPKAQIEERTDLWFSMGWSFERGRPGRYGKPTSFTRLS
ncbi:DEAD/DEAH box helicase family protein [Alterinioella nitratireducens]|uniref:DEAD/DEAH box helicase family protein n=1 Tax=Alterinioella nitratireducens TaxID=2735915 RepID=UPI001556226B|nr:DEAD/DEAH box helicase family protein [Alterinioella nitratireducens]NPD21740.1 hypothetical protein [Alterinioella nitratireducens]